MACILCQQICTLAKWMPPTFESWCLLYFKGAGPTLSLMLLCAVLLEEAKRKTMILGRRIFHFSAIVSTKKSCLSNPLCHTSTSTMYMYMCLSFPSWPFVNFQPHGYMYVQHISYYKRKKEYLSKFKLGIQIGQMPGSCNIKEDTPPLKTTCTYSVDIKWIMYLRGPLIHL